MFCLPWINVGPMHEIDFDAISDDKGILSFPPSVAIEKALHGGIAEVFVETSPRMPPLNPACPL